MKCVTSRVNLQKYNTNSVNEEFEFEINDCVGLLVLLFLSCILNQLKLYLYLLTITRVLAWGKFRPSTFWSYNGNLYVVLAFEKSFTFLYNLPLQCFVENQILTSYVKFLFSCMHTQPIPYKTFHTHPWYGLHSVHNI